MDKFLSIGYGRPDFPQGASIDGTITDINPQAEFFGLLRAWHEDGKNRDIWKKPRLVVVHSTEVYIPMNINQSLFNIGLPTELTLNI